MAIDKEKEHSTPAKMLQIQNMQKPVLSGNIFEDAKAEEKDSPTIHSGHFMVSRVHEDKDDDDDEEAPIFPNDSKDFPVTLGYDFVMANKSTSQTYNFGPKSTQTLSIDASLTKLFECMTLAYSGKITSPKWKPFRGLHLTVKDKVRLNNIIWREWHMQYIFLRRPIVCQFATPLSDYIHTRPEAVVLEGKYWKRRLDTVTKEYKKWRRFYRDRILQAMPEALFPASTYSHTEDLSEWELLERVKEVQVMPFNIQQSSTDLSLLNADLMDMDFTDNLFSSLNQPFAFPNPKELGGLSCADLIQPGLVQLQPNLEDFMDIDGMQEFLVVSRPSSNFGGFMAQSSSMAGHLMSGLTASTDIRHSQNLPSHSVQGLLDPGLFNTNNVNNTAGISMLTALVAMSNTATSMGASSRSVSTSSTLVNDTYSADTHMVKGDSFATVSKQPFTASLTQHGHFLTSNASGSASAESTMKPSSQSTLTMHKQSPTQTLSLTGLGLSQSLSALTSSNRSSKISHGASSKTVKGQSPSRAGGSSLQNKQSKSESKGTARTCPSDQSPATRSATGKRDGFAVPQGKPMTVPRKPRSIAPAPAAPAATSSSSGTQSTYLAQLLTKGTYPGASVHVKTEPPGLPTSVGGSNYTPIFPAPQAAPALAPTSVTTFASPLTSSPVKFTDLAIDINKSGVDFPTSVLLAAASSALRTSSANLKDALRLNTSTAAVASGLENTMSTSNPTRSPVRMAVSPSPGTPPPSTSAFLEASSPTVSILASPPMLNQDDGSCLSGIRIGIHTEQRRQAHLSAEQKRRCNLKSGFDLLHTLVPSLAQNPKVSKATMLQKTAEHCRKMKAERAQMQHEAAILKQEIESLNNAISVVQSQLPETGVPVTRQRVDQMKEMFEEYVRNRTLQNWKFWIFSIIIRSLFDSYNNMVSTAGTDELCRTAVAWLDQHCSLVALRPTVLNALRHLSMSTSILTEPQRVQEQATQAVIKGGQSKFKKPGGNAGYL